MNFISTSDFNTAFIILQTCLRLLQIPLGEEFHVLSFQTYNNIAHSFNIQGQVDKSIENLVYALEYALRVNNLEHMHTSYDGRDKIPIVETYINICNAYTF